jgi:hypothetical protein
LPRDLEGQILRGHLLQGAPMDTRTIAVLALVIAVVVVLILVL